MSPVLITTETPGQSPPPYQPENESTVGSRQEGPDGLSAPSSFQWRVVNDEMVEDHWNIGELRFFDDNGKDTTSKIERVICSHNYDNHDLSVVHNGKWSTMGHASRQVWAGSDRPEGQKPGGSWLGYKFSAPLSISAVAIAQASDNFAKRFQAVQRARVEYRDKLGDWRSAGIISLNSPVEMSPVLITTETPGQSPPPYQPENETTVGSRQAGPDGLSAPSSF